MEQKQTIVETDDTSTTLFSEKYGEHYHSTFGAQNESQHIFIEAGFKQIQKTEVSIFEMGFGTGLNAYLTLKTAQELNKKVKYIGVEKYPVSKDLIQKLSFANNKTFLDIHKADWEKKIQISKHFELLKQKTDLLKYSHKEFYDLVYFDAFSPEAQPYLWSEDIFRELYNHMNKGAILTTYSVKGIVKRALKSVGFEIEKLAGPTGKREILRAKKID